MHDTLTIRIPVLAILFGILLNQRGLDKLESRMDRTQADLSRFYQILREHGGKIDLLSKSRNPT